MFDLITAFTEVTTYTALVDVGDIAEVLENEILFLLFLLFSDHRKFRYLEKLALGNYFEICRHLSYPGSLLSALEVLFLIF